MAYKYKYLIFKTKPFNRGEMVARINVSHLTKPQAKKLWKELDEKYPSHDYASCLSETNEVLHSFETAGKS